MREHSVYIDNRVFPATDNAVPHYEKGVLWYTFPALDEYGCRLRHGFSSRLGGVSSGSGLDSLNLGIGRGDTGENVAENYSCFGAAAGFDPAHTVFTWQDHHTCLREAVSADLGKGLLRQRDYQSVDGLWTAQREVTLIAHFADCTPLFFYAPDRHIAAVSHAGWRGTCAHMAGISVRCLQQQGCDPRQLIAVIGPSAGPGRYQVDAACAAHFAGFADEQGPVFRPDPACPDHYLLDLWRANRVSLLRAGVLPEHISIAGLCTISHPDIFYSHRVQGNARGSLAGFITLL